jgi:DnaK suppressor protein
VLTAINLITTQKTLEEQRANLLAYVEKKQGSTHPKSETNPDNADRAITFRNSNKAMLLLEHVEKQLADIDQALKRLDAGTYGICADCGEEIQPERLDIMPAAALCVECQRRQDRR